MGAARVFVRGQDFCAGGGRTSVSYDFYLFRGWSCPSLPMVQLMHYKLSLEKALKESWCLTQMFCFLLTIQTTGLICLAFFKPY